mgnify:CR=1 FL=1
MNFVVGLLLLVMKDEENREEKVFWLMDTLINNILPGTVTFSKLQMLTDLVYVLCELCVLTFIFTFKTLMCPQQWEMQNWIFGLVLKASILEMSYSYFILISKTYYLLFYLFVGHKGGLNCETLLYNFCYQITITLTCVLYSFCYQITITLTCAL